MFYKKPIAPTGFTTCIHEPFTIPTRKLRNSIEERLFFLNGSQTKALRFSRSAS
ncbi:hypothetical protein RBSH_01836 [Rhodopirellula baltica SH28]|uniref:Uncharacterized protein n=2 Tax=Rhodopirellula TaxID=265488 RepID=M2B1Q1_9BACT|nr:hypothetical protein RBSH_01836 [Rhodopirellula baltica SH28]EMB16139.1 hypothetical protein RE6C_03163 [Rhodopirellula europaea 6C]